MSQPRQSGIARKGTGAAEPPQKAPADENAEQGRGRDRPAKVFARECGLRKNEIAGRAESEAQPATENGKPQAHQKRNKMVSGEIKISFRREGKRSSPAFSILEVGKEFFLPFQKGAAAIRRRANRAIINVLTNFDD